MRRTHVFCQPFFLNWIETNQLCWHLHSWRCAWHRCCLRCSGWLSLHCLVQGWSAYIWSRYVGESIYDQIPPNPKQIDINCSQYILVSLGMLLLTCLGHWLRLEHRPCTTCLQRLLSWAILSSCFQLSPVWVMSSSRSRRHVFFGLPSFACPEGSTSRPVS